VLLRRLESFISQCIVVDEKYLSVLADFVLSTWFVDRLEVAPYLSVVGLPQSGKTTLLKVLSLVCRRSLLIADISSFVDITGRQK
jgi:ABC-type polysaccharide/polyol phosphate transport system ATPase subunit